MSPADSAGPGFEYRQELAGREIPRSREGSRTPGWDEPADLEKDPAEVPDPALVDVPAKLRTEIEKAMARYPDRHSAALPALRAAQDHHGWCSPQAILEAACVMRVTPGYLTSVATFYDMFELQPAGENIVYVCTNISCSLRGADELYASLEAEVGERRDITLRHFECLGACDIAPMVSVDHVYYGPLGKGDAKRLVGDLRAGREPIPELALALRATAASELRKEQK
ncbi:MAG TPA: NAD(P)H-dependent oxidoreductase subunit E [Solirubrobacteraceae bacterium]|nr:NAD(P)H-dependent oxidoreductase subunit E [Solirubrobacteraceae bacterium]